MTARPRSPSLTLGLAPNSRGFGWAAFDGPFSTYDFGVVFVSSNKNERCIRHFERLLDRLEPELVVLEEVSAKTNRMRDLHRMLRLCALRRSVEVAVYSRADMHRCFATVGARTNQQIAEAVAKQVSSLAHKLPRKRECWSSEDRRLALFAAAALVITHFHDGGSKFLQDLKRAA